MLVLYTVIVSIWNRHLRLYWARSGLIIAPILTAVCISQETPKYWSWEVMLMEMNRTSTLLPTVCSTWERIGVEWVVSLWKHVNLFLRQICAADLHGTISRATLFSMINCIKSTLVSESAWSTSKTICLVQKIELPYCSHNKQRHRKVPLSSFHLNGHNLGFHSQT